MCRSALQDFECRASEVASVRRFTLQCLSRWGLRPDDPAVDVRDELELISGELAANAAKFCRDRFRVRVEAHHDHVVLGVEDDGPGRAALAPTPPAPDAESGRGLFIVDALASRWGVEPAAGLLAGGGVRVWARLEFAASSSRLARECGLARPPSPAPLGDG